MHFNQYLLWCVYLVYRCFCYNQDAPRPRPSTENMFLNELIREYLEFNQYKHSLSVFVPGKPYSQICTSIFHFFSLHSFY